MVDYKGNDGPWREPMIQAVKKVNEKPEMYEKADALKKQARELSDRIPNG